VYPYASYKNKANIAELISLERHLAVAIRMVSLKMAEKAEACRRG
jgi:hypothetical protein